MSDSEYMTTAELARYLSVSEVKLMQDRARGRGVPFLKIGRSVRYARADVQKWISSQTATNHRLT